MKIKAEIDGLEGAFKSLEGLKRSARNKILRPALNAAANPILKSAKALVPVRYKLLKKSLGKKSKTYAASGTVVVVIGARRGFKQQVGTRKRDGKKGRAGDAVMADPANYAHLVELGHGGPKPAPAHPFLRPAYEQSRSAARSLIIAKIREGLEKEAKRLAAKAAK